MASQAGSAVPRSVVLKAVAIVCALLLALTVSWAQDPQGPPPPVNSQQAGPLLSPEQLDNLVAPIALYPDPLLSQALAASTYPLEIVEAQQWLQANSNLRGEQLMDAAKQQNWDPSVQALIAFPDAFRLLSSDIRWTTDLGNAFLAQQADVMNAVQRMRARARANGRLNNTPQETVTTETQDGQNAIEIQPANPQVVYVPVYDPAYVWGPPVWGAYPDLWYPGFSFGFGFGPGIFIDSFFPGCGGWGGWGWGCGWFGHGLFLNTGFFHRYGFHDGFGRGFNGGFGGRGFGGRTAWTHDPVHRMGVPYANRVVASRFNSNQFQRGQGNRGQFGGGNRANVGTANGGLARGGFGNRASGAFQSNRAAANAGANGFRSPSAGGWQHFSGGNRAAANGSYGGFSRYASPNNGARTGSQAYRAPAQSYRGYNSASAFGRAPSNQAPSYNRSFRPAYSAPRQSFSAPRQSFSAPRQSFSAPRSFSAPHYSGGGFSGGHSGGSSGGHSGGGGGGHRR